MRRVAEYAIREYGIAFAHRVPCPLCRARTGGACTADDKPHAARRATAKKLGRPPLDTECRTCGARRGGKCARVVGTHAVRIARASREQLPTRPRPLTAAIR